MKIKLLALFICTSGWLFSQDLKEDLIAVSEKMKESESVAIEVSVSVFSQKGGTKVYATEASMLKQGELSKRVLGEMEFVHSAKYDIRVDNDEKMILIYDRDKVAEKLDFESMDIDAKALRKILESKEETDETEIRLISNSNNVRKYSVSGADGLNEIEITLDMNKLAIQSMSYEFEATDLGGQFVQLDYTSYRYDSDLSKDLNTQNYFRLNDGSIELTERFKAYTLYTEQ